MLRQMNRGDRAPGAGEGIVGAAGWGKREILLLSAAGALMVVGGAVQHFLSGIFVPGAPMYMLLALLLRWTGVLLLVVFGIGRRSLTPWIFVAMVAGAELGFDVPHVATSLRVFSDIFLRLIKTIVAPLILATLITGIASHGDLKSVGRMGLKALIYFEVVTTLALVIGLAAINLSHAGVGLALPASGSALVTATAPPPPTRWDDFLLHVFPENLAKSIADGQILQVAVFAIFFGIALATLPDAKRSPVLRLTESLSEVMFRFTNVVMYFAPIGVGAAMAYTVGHLGLGVLVNLGKLLATLYAALVAFGLLVLLPAALLFRVPVRRFVRAVAEPATIAFATAASEAALPRAMEQMEALGVPRRIVAFVIPAGYSFNLDGSTLYLAVASIFVAQAGGVHLSIGQQLLMMGTLVLTSKGVAGVPRATLVVLLATAATFRLPAEPIFVILGVDALMDMARTTINVVGNCLASVVVAKWEGQFGTETPDPIVLEGVHQ
jgi:proton glutamate symport protein